MKLSIGYFTGREDPKIQWFFESLARQNWRKDDELELILIDTQMWSNPSYDRASKFFECYGENFLRNLKTPIKATFQHIPPKPSVWQGPTRLTTRDWWAASSARNTLFCEARHEFVACVDDLSVIVPGWLERVREAHSKGYVVCGSYKKLHEMTYEGGKVSSTGEDADFRLSGCRPGGVRQHNGEWLAGCNFALPLEWALSVNGFDELADSLSSEDYLFGIRLNKAGYRLCYDPLAMTLESRDDHHTEGNTLLRSDYSIPGAPDKDFSHFILRTVREGGPQSHGTPDLRRLRDMRLRGEPYPVPDQPREHPYIQVPLPDLKPQHELHSG